MTTNRKLLEGKTAIVTGGASGIGAAVAQQLADNGASVVIADVADNGEEFATKIRTAGGRALFVRTDVSRSAEIGKTVETLQREFGGLDILVNCAGIFPRANLLNTDEQLWDRIMNVNLKGVYLCCKAVVPLMKERGGGSIVNIGSNHAAAGSAELFAYSVSKGGLLTLTRNLARALATYNIRVNCVNPGWVATEGEVALRESEGRSREWLEEQGRRSLLGRLQTGEDLAAAVLFLVMPQAGQINGQIFSVDGGASAR
ncbi:MAG: family oxidoreductase [Paenibacillaceae bacterium]|jgi:NAD(P)-dependent dehydrogenase (short-subunit alcohol dehydrogenase family)|nr:family oxidoreductase [Paenibacillaceae bacterium]